MYYWGNLLLMLINGSIQSHITLKSIRDTQLDIHETHNPNDFFPSNLDLHKFFFRLKWWYIKGSYIPIIDFIEMHFFGSIYIYILVPKNYEIYHGWWFFGFRYAPFYGQCDLTTWKWGWSTHWKLSCMSKEQRKKRSSLKFKRYAFTIFYHIYYTPTHYSQQN
jgi:hypothetical protein